VLSDDDLVTMLKQSGVEIARRTVAKYREAMAISILGSAPARKTRARPRRGGLITEIAKRFENA
jgi:RNA polymerase sigma-54 factor